MAPGGRNKFSMYSHRLHQRDDERLERRIERLAKQCERLRGVDGGGSESSRYRASVIDLYQACLKYFYVTGDDLNGKSYDDVFIDLLQGFIPRYDSKKGLFVHYIANVYPLRVRDAGERQEKEADNIDSLDDQTIESSYDERLAIEDTYDLDQLSEQPDAGGSLSDDGQSEAATAGEQGIYWQLLLAIMGFLNHKEDSRHQAVSKLYYRMIFAERITYAVKSQELFEYCLPIVRRERDTFEAMELGFLDSFMVDVVRTVRALWSGAMRDDYVSKMIRRLRERMDSYAAGETDKPPKINWLGIDAYKSYLKEQYGIEVSSAAISMQRDRFNRLAEEIGTAGR